MAEEALKELRLATEIPLQIAVLSISLAEKALTVFDLGFKSARGDSGVAISAALSGASGAISIVYLNLSYFKGGEWAVNTRNRADELTGKTSALQGELFRRLEQLRQTVIDKEPKSSS